MKVISLTVLLLSVCAICSGQRFKRQEENITNLPSAENIEPSGGITLPTFEEGCGVLGKHVSYQKVIGGRPPAIGTWPWIALLGSVDTSGQSFKCGGTIITRRHVLTAAHCVTPILSFVRLGEHDINNLTETQHVDIPIQRAVKHPNFKLDKHAGHSDIAVLYLERDILFTDFIRPVCLPQTELYRNLKYRGYKPFIAGWGTTNPDTQGQSSLLQQAQITVQDNSYCDVVYRLASRIKSGEDIDDAFICAGDPSGEQDSCYGDSGGPLLIAVNPNKMQHHFLLIGVVSGGLRCGSAEASSLYTRTSFFIDWISDRVAEPI